MITVVGHALVGTQAKRLTLKVPIIAMSFSSVSSLLHSVLCSLDALRSAARWTGNCGVRPKPTRAVSVNG